MKKIEEKVIKFIDENNLISPGDKLLLGLSGGPDSVFALHFFNKFKRRFKIDLCAVHINHQLRINAAKDEDFSKQLCNSLGVEFTSEKVDINKLKKKSKKSIEEIAREERYKIFADQAEKSSVNKIVTAHNQNDNTETILLNLIKGTGSKGLIGIPVKRGNIIRPFLSISKEEILEYLDKNKIEFRIDESNLKSDYQRNFLRNEIIPKLIESINPALHQNIFRTSQNISSFNELVAEYLDDLANKYWETFRGKIYLKTGEINKIDQSIIGEIVKRGLQKFYDPKTTSTDIKKLSGLISAQVGKKIKLRNKYYATREREKIILSNEEIPELRTYELKPGEEISLHGKKFTVQKVDKKNTKMDQKGIEFVSIDDDYPRFIVRPWTHGDKFQPLGMSNFKKVSDFLTDLKIPASEKKEKFVLEYRNKVVCIIGLRIDNRFKITSKSNQVYKICLK